MPAIEGLDAIWGKRAHICPYCDGFEYGTDGALGVLATSPMAEHQVNLLATQWSSDVTLFAAPEWFEASDARPAPALHPAIKIKPAAASLKWSGAEEDNVHVFDAAGAELGSVRGLFFPTNWVVQSQLAKDAGAETHAMGFVMVDTEFTTSVDGLFAIGDCAWMRGAKMPSNRIPEALGSGARAAAWISAGLIKEAMAAAIAAVKPQ